VLKISAFKMQEHMKNRRDTDGLHFNFNRNLWKNAYFSSFFGLMVAHLNFFGLYWLDYDQQQLKIQKIGSKNFLNCDQARKTQIFFEKMQSSAFS
jgi:hypothetical protein